MITPKVGPKWENVRRRITYDLETDELIESVCIDGGVKRDYEYKLPDAGRNTRTVFHYKACKLDLCEVYSPPESALIV